MKLEGKRKLLGFVILIGLSACMVFFDKMKALTWADFAKWVFIAFISGDGLEWITKLKGAGKQ